MKYRTLLFSLLVIFFLISGSYADTSNCPDPAAAANAVNESQIKNWNDLYQAFRANIKCDSAALSETYSYFIVSTLANEWNTLSDLRKITSADNSFKAFILKHINADAEPRDVVALLSNATERCPAEDIQFCSAINKEVRKTLQDLGALKK